MDRLSQDEAQITVAQTLGVVHGLVGSVKVVMEGAKWSRSFSNTFQSIVPIDGKVSTDGIQQDLGRCLARNR